MKGNRYEYIVNEFVTQDTEVREVSCFDARRSGGIPTSHLPLAVRIRRDSHPDGAEGHVHVKDASPTVMWRLDERWRPAPRCLVRLWESGMSLHSIHALIMYNSADVVGRGFDQSPHLGYTSLRKGA